MLNRPQKYDDKDILCVGSITLRKDYRFYLGSMPHDMVSHVVDMIEYGRYKYINLHGYKTRYGTAEIFNVHFDNRFEDYEEDYGEDDFYSMLICEQESCSPKYPSLD